MLEDLFAIHRLVMADTPKTLHRYLYSQINWKNKGLCILGGRGVGKTTLMCQYLLEKYKTPDQALYISADNIHVLSQGLFAIAQEYFKYGGQALMIDEVHKYPNWSLELKNILDTYKNKHIIFSASSSIELKKSKYDLSRRVVYYELKGLSFREFLQFKSVGIFPVFTLNEILHEHVTIVEQFNDIPILKYFSEYLQSGYFPFFLEGTKDYLAKVTNILEKIIFEDISLVFNLKPPSLLVLKKLLWLVATSEGLVPNIDRISRSLAVSREMVYQSFEYLDRASLLNNVYHDGIGMKLIRKPSKVYLENTNYLYAIYGGLNLTHSKGMIRETFFVNQCAALFPIHLHHTADFVINKELIIEVGGTAKKFTQLNHQKNSFLAIDGIEIGAGRKIPLYLFGFMY